MAEQVLTVDGTPLKKKLAEALFLSRLRAFGLVVPLLALIIAAFVVPVVLFLWGGIYNDSYSGPMHRTSAYLKDWEGEAVPGEEAYAALVSDILEASAIDRPMDVLPTPGGP